MTKIKIDLYDLIDTLTNGNMSTEVDDYIQIHGLDQSEIDVGELLQEQRIIADFWHLEDVRERRPDLDNNQCWNVLKLCHEHLQADHNYRIRWIESAAEELYGPPTISFCD